MRRNTPRSSARIAGLLFLSITWLCGLAARAEAFSLREAIATRIEQMLSSDDVAVEGLEIGSDLGLRIDSLTLKDRDGAWLVARGLVADWTPTALFRGRVEIDTLTAERIDVLRQPLSGAEPDTPGPDENRSFLPDLPVTIKVGRFALPIHLAAPVAGRELSLTTDGSAELGGANLVLRLNAAAEDPTPSRLTAILRYDAELAEFDISAQFDEPRGGTVARLLGLPEDTPASLRIDGEGPPGDWAGDLAVRIADERCVDTRVKVDIPGRRLGLNGNGRPSCFQPDLALVEALGQVGFSSTLTAPSDGEVTVEAAEFVTPFGRMTLAGTVRPDRLDLNYGLADLNLTRLAPHLGIAASGRVEAAGRVHGAIADPEVSLTLRAGAGAVSGAQWQGLVAEATASGLATGRIAFSGEGRVNDPVYPGMPRVAFVGWQAGGVVAVESGRIDLSRLTITAPGHDVSAQGWLAQWGRRSDLEVRARIGDIAPLAPGVGLAGAVTAKGRVTGDLLARDFVATVDAEATGFQTGVAQVDGLLGPEIAIEATIAGKGESLLLREARLQGGDVTLAASGSVLPAALSWEIQLASLAALGLTGEASAEGRIEGDLVKPVIPLRVRLDSDQVQASAEAVVEVQDGAAAIRLSQFVATRGSESVLLAAPTRIVVGPSIRIDPTILRLGDGSLALSGAIDTGGGLKGTLTLKDLPLSLAALAAPELGLQGRLNGEILVSGRMDRPEASFRLRALGVGARAAPERLEAEVIANGAWRDEMLRVDVSAQALGGVTAKASGNMPLTLAGLPENAPLDAALTLRGDAARLAELVPALAAQRLEGRLSLEGRATGTAQEPLLSGRLAIEDGVYESYDLGTLMRDLTLVAVLRPDGAVIVNGEANDGQDGRLAVEGEGQWRDQPRLDVAIRVQNFQAVRLDAASAALQGVVTLSGDPEDRLAVTGQLAIEEAVVDIAEFMGPKVVTLEVVEVGQPSNPANLPQPSEAVEPVESRLGPTIDLDIGIDIRRATIRGQGLDSEWRGAIAVKGSAAQPRIEGPIRVQRGTYSILGKQFTLSPNSQIVFEGRTPPNPRLDVTASVRADDIIAKVIVSGLASDPTLDLASEPQVPKDEILARILFGRKLGTLSAAQQLQLAQAAASLVFGGKGGGFDPVGSVRDFLGFDTLSVGGDGGGAGGGRFVSSSGLASPTGVAGGGSTEGAGGGLAPSVTAGKYIDPDTYLRVGRSEEGGSVSVERQLGGGFSVQTEVGARTGGGVSLRWTKDY